MRCPYQCHEIGGPWIAENPDCPEHGYRADGELKQARRTAEYWKAEHLAGNELIDELVDALKDLLTMPESDGTFSMGKLRKSIKDQAKAVLQKAEGVKQ